MMLQEDKKYFRVKVVCIYENDFAKRLGWRLATPFIHLFV